MKIASFASLFAAQKPPRPLRPEDARSRIATSLMERETKRFDEMREAAERLKTLPRSNPIREQAKARAAALLQRIRALKMAIATATPEQAKALASQLRQLAAQLAGVSAQSGGESGGAQEGGWVGAVGQEKNPSADSGETGVVAEAETVEASSASAESTRAEAVQAGREALAAAQERPLSAPGNSRDDGLKEAVAEIRRELRKAAAMLKAKLLGLKRSEAGEAMDDVQEVERIAGAGETFELSTIDLRA